MAPATADSHGDRSRTTEIYDNNSFKRRGTMIEKRNGDVNVYDRGWNRIGSGSRQRDGSMKIYRPDGTRWIESYPRTRGR